MKRALTVRIPMIALLGAGALAGILAIFLESRIAPYAKAERYDTMVVAAGLMESAERDVAVARTAAGFGIDRATDLNGTGLIGVEYSPTTTSLGELEAKRTSASPDMAALMVSLLTEAGVKDGDAIAVGASGSFPGATLATLAAARAMDLDVALIASLGASTWGANLPGFSYLAIHEATRPVLGCDLLGVSLGGANDYGSDMEEEGRLALVAEMSRRRAPVIASRGTADAVLHRMALYRSFAGDRKFAAFVNIGGAAANIGDGLESLSLQPGFNPGVAAMPADPDGAVLFAMAAEGVPVIHILNIRGLAARHGLDWDPSPFPPSGAGRVYRRYDRGVYATRLALLTAAYLAFLAFLAVLWLAGRRNASTWKSGPDSR